MQKVVCVNKSYENTLQSSLSAIKQAHLQLHILTDRCATATVLASRIELFDLLLEEILCIRSTLAEDLRCAREVPQTGLTGLELNV